MNRSTDRSDRAGLTLEVLVGTYAVCRQSAEDSIPAWAMRSHIFSVTRTVDELSIVCEQRHVPVDTRCERDWRCIRVRGPLEFGLIGVLASLVSPLSEAGVSTFALSTYDTDYFLVKDKSLAAATSALVKAGHTVLET